MESSFIPMDGGMKTEEHLIYEACQLRFANNYDKQKLESLNRLMENASKNMDANGKAMGLVTRHVKAVQVKRANNPWLWVKKIFHLLSKDDQSLNDLETSFLTHWSSDPASKPAPQKKRVDHNSFLLDFYTDENDHPRKLGIRFLAADITTEWSTIQACSKTFFRYSGNDYVKYCQYMKDYFCGEHFLIKDNGALADELSQLKAVHLRSSSHYAFGSTDGLKGGKVPENKKEAYQNGVEPQYEITGDQVGVLLFSKVCLKINHTGQTGQQASFIKDTQGKVFVIEPKNAANGKTYSWLQTEWAPDSANWREANFWKHRVFSFGLYVIRKLLKMERPNIGPYGYGHGDLNAGGVGPTILDKPQDQGFGTVIINDEGGDEDGDGREPESHDDLKSLVSET